MIENRRIISLQDDLKRQVDTEDWKLIEPILAEYADDPAGLVEFIESFNSYDWEHRPVDPETFLLHKDYLGLGGDRGKLYPGLVDIILDIIHTGYTEVFFDGAIGWGKSYTMEALEAWYTYYLSCLKKPQLFYGLGQDDTIACLNVSVNVTQAKKVVFQRLKEKIRSSPYFRESFPFDPVVTSELHFPKNIRCAPAAASEGGTVGYTVFMAVMDEVNFWQMVESSTMNRGDRFDQADHIHTLLKRRIQSRFMERGGPLVAASSSKYPDSFTEKKRDELKEKVKLFDLGEGPKPRVFIKRMSQWTPKPEEMFSDERFWLYLGGKADEFTDPEDAEKTSFRPFITMKDEEIAPYREQYPDRCLEVPMNYWEDFKQNLEGSIRDIAGYPTLTITPWLKEMDKLMDAFQRAREHGIIHPMNRTETSLEDGGRFVPDSIKFDESKLYYAHVDLAKGHRDKVGLTVGHVDHWKEVTRTIRDEETGDTTLVTEIVPYIVIDLQLRIKAPNEENDVSTDLVRGLLLELREHGCNLRKVTYDQWNSMSSIQALIRAGIDADELSVDRTMGPYNAFKEALLEDRIDIYSYKPLIEEVSSLEHDTSKDKVDHPPGGSKDVSDSMAAVCFHCTESEPSSVGEISYGISESPSPLEGAVPRHVQKARSQAKKKGRRAGVDDVIDAMLRDDPYLSDDDGDDDFIGFA